MTSVESIWVHTTCWLAGREEGGAVNEAAILVGAVVSGHYLCVYFLAVYDEKVCGVWKGDRIKASRLHTIFYTHGCYVIHK